MTDEDNLVTLSHAEPVLSVSNILQTVDYWHNVLGFVNKWTWGEPPNHGGVAWQGAFVQFSLNPELAAASKGNAIFIRVKNLPLLYQLHQDKNADIVEPLENKPWGMAGYTVREINGYYVVFAGALISDREKAVNKTYATVKVASRMPTPEEYLHLVSAVGWDKYTNHSLVDKILVAAAYSVVAQDDETGEAIGCALLLTDHASFYYVKDVMVDPRWQGKGVGSMLMKEVMRWLNENAAENAFVGLFTGENLAAFYKQFDFAPAFGMVKRILRNTK
ncbi:MAG TPA: GNAT family N-acetyltransferase [Chitinophagaceae bacterium]|nr:GNAT family N-acetyltransferase [Chitinophagaceae bacterium]